MNVAGSEFAFWEEYFAEIHVVRTTVVAGSLGRPRLTGWAVVSLIVLEGRVRLVGVMDDDGGSRVA